MSDSKTPPPVDTSRVLEELKGRDCDKPLLVGEGSYCGYTDHERVGVVIAEGNDTGQLLWDGYLPKQKIRRFRYELSRDCSVYPGQLDFMHATDWSYAWTTPEAPFRLITPEGLVGWIDDNTLLIRPQDDPELRVPVRIPISEIERVDATISASWRTHSVVVIADGQRVIAATNTVSPPEPPHKGPEAFGRPPVYDWMLVQADTVWIRRLARALARALGVSCRPHG